METILLERYIKEVLKEEAEYLELPDLTWKDLRDFVNEVIDINKDKNNKELRKKIVEKGVGLILAGFGITDMFKIGQLANEGIEIVLSYIASKLYDINGKSKVKDNPFKIDQSVSELIDDKAEELFILWFGNDLKNKSKYPDDGSIGDFDMTKKLQEWLNGDGKLKYGGANITK